MILILVMLFFALAAIVMETELLVRRASRLAVILGVSQLVIGLTIVSFGTSAPEFVVSIKGTLTNHSDLVVGNWIIGSNIFNVLFIIGACTIIAPLVVTKQLKNSMIMEIQVYKSHLQNLQRMKKMYYQRESLSRF